MQKKLITLIGRIYLANGEPPFRLYNPEYQLTEADIDGASRCFEEEMRKLIERTKKIAQLEKECDYLAKVLVKNGVLGVCSKELGMEEQKDDIQYSLRKNFQINEWRKAAKKAVEK